MASISCPCGFRAETDDDFDLWEARRAFDGHSCPNHPPREVAPTAYTWSYVARTAVIGAVLVLLVWICAGLPGVVK